MNDDTHVIPSGKVLAHYGTPRRSGRYPWGSGGGLLQAIEDLKADGLTEVEIAKALDMSTGTLRSQKALAKIELKEAQRAYVVRERKAGVSVQAISAESGIPPRSVRALLEAGVSSKKVLIDTISKTLETSLDTHPFVDVGEGVEAFMGVSRTKLKNAITALKAKGYQIFYLRETQLGTGHQTSIMVLAPPGATYKELLDNRAKVGIPNYYTRDNGKTFESAKAPINVSSKRLDVVYAKDGGTDRDGLVELRRNVDELSLGTKRYAQVRIAVDGTHYIKGMAVYSDDLPPGVDMRFHTSKDSTGNHLDALKPQKIGEDNVFGATVKQKTYTLDGVEHPSALNIVYEEGKWSSWSKSLASQFLSKQSPKLAKEQLDISYQKKLQEFEDIMALDNPVVQKHLLGSFSNTVDAAAVHLEAAALPRQTTNVLLPEPTLKPGEVYAPNYKNGESVVLIRYPHGGIFEIPRLVVNNKNLNAKKIIGPAKDAVAVHPDVASQLSGADYDGDNVVVIPNSRKRIRASKTLEGLKNFDPRAAYPPYDGMTPMTKTGTQLHMGKISNLITDMTIKGAPESEIVRAVRHSMVVIDAEKHGLNYTQSARDNGITALKRRYSSDTGGAATLISKASSQARVPHRRDYYTIDPVTGAKVFTHTGDTYIDKSGKVIKKQTLSTKGYETDDAHKLSSGTVIETVYANHANRLKALGDKARLASVNATPRRYSPSARKVYAVETESLNSKLVLAQRHQPLERKAQLLGGQILRAKKAANPDWSKAEIQKARGQALVVARSKIGGTKPLIDITPREWEAIQMGAISPTKLTRILRNADMDVVKQYATPIESRGLSASKTNRATQLLAAGYTPAEVASAVGATQSQIINIDL